MELVSEGKTILYSRTNDRHMHSVSLMLNKEVTKALIGWKPVNDCIITVRFQSRHVRAMIMEVYIQTEELNDVDKNIFYA